MKNVEQFLQRFINHRSVTLELIDCIEDVAFKPWEGAMSAGLLMLHTIGASDFFANIAITGTIKRPDLSSSPDVSNISVVRDFAHSLSGKTVDTLNSLSDDQFKTIIKTSNPIFGSNPTVAQILNFMLEHEIHHKGQLFLYARMTNSPIPKNFIAH
ncbi:DinB family protein [Priestia megaterium]|uniref:DinB family protein n=1 Tax=Priestia megaterium TaxID=1404 RepID=UPI000E1455FF|nr:DinB family protein [Priestia megaterium]SSY69936.1 DinB family protein [Priestia megaterium]